MAMLVYQRVFESLIRLQYVITPTGFLRLVGQSGPRRDPVDSLGLKWQETYHRSLLGTPFKGTLLLTKIRATLTLECFRVGSDFESKKVPSKQNPLDFYKPKCPGDIYHDMKNEQQVRPTG